MKLAPALSTLSALLLTSASQPAAALNVNVKCLPPEVGTYSLGWGTSRLVVPKNARPYILFRGKAANVDGTICRSGDNVGLVVFKKDGTVWAYTRVDE